MSKLTSASSKVLVKLSTFFALRGKKASSSTKPLMQALLLVKGVSTMHRLLFILFASFCMNIAFGNDLLHTYSKIHFELENRNYDLDQCILKLKSSPPSDIYKNECSIVVSGQVDKSRALTEELEAKARKLVQDYQKNGLDKVTLLQIEDARN